MAWKGSGVRFPSAPLPRAFASAWAHLGAHARGDEQCRGRCIDVAWIYPVSLIMALFISPSMVALPLAARLLLGAAIITIAVQVVIMPVRSRLRARRHL